jgi:predicted MPP superfamily phosphohydrolase
MPTLAGAAFWLAALIGHLAWWTWLTNRVHGLGLPRWAIKSISLVLHLVAGTALGCLAWQTWLWLEAGRPATWRNLPVAVVAYAGLCAATALAPLPWTLWRNRPRRPPAALRSCAARRVDVAGRLTEHAAGGPLTRLMLGLPGNECLSLEVSEKTLALPRLDPALEGLSIAHLSDLHLTGKIRRAWFEEVIACALDLRADLVAVTGDLVDKRRCLEWIPGTLGRLSAPNGVYFVLGNHDQRVEVRALRQALADCGLIDLGGQWKVQPIRGRPVVLAGDERPWFRPGPRETDRPLPAAEAALNLLLAHTPDQYHWARRQQFDLMLAGHLHGGQIRFPVVGPVVAPSLHGVRYAGGVYHEGPTVLHVSRGISGVDLVRWSCPPEISKLVLVRG